MPRSSSSRRTLSPGISEPSCRRLACTTPRSCASSLDATAAFMLDHVQPAFLLESARPTAGPFIFAVVHRPSTRPAANTWIILVVQWVIGYVVLDDEGPNLMMRPAQQGIDLHQVEFGVPLHHPSFSPVARLIAPDGTDPGFVAGHRSPQRHNLPIMTALVRPMDIHGAAVLLLVLGHGQLRTHQLDRDPVTLLDP